MTRSQKVFLALTVVGAVLTGTVIVAPSNMVRAAAGGLLLLVLAGFVVRDRLRLRAAARARVGTLMPRQTVLYTSAGQMSMDDFLKFAHTVDPTDDPGYDAVAEFDRNRARGGDAS